VALLSDETVRTLAAYQGAGSPVTTCYLDVDGRRLPTHRDVQQELARLVRSAGLNGGGRNAVDSSVKRDLHRMEQYVKGQARGSTRGLAMFSCSAAGFWQVYELPVRVSSQLVVEPVPCVRQLEVLLEDYQRIAVLLTDRQRARLFVFELGELVEHSEQVDRLARRSDDDRGERVKTRQGSQLSEQARQHLKRAAQLAFDVLQRTGFDHLAIAAPSDVLADLEHSLHPYLRDRLVEPLHLGVGASDGQIAAAAMELEQRLERKSEADQVTQLRDAVRSGGRGVAGLAPTLGALSDGRVDRLFVSAGYQAEGWQCDGCRRLAAVGRSCPRCHTKMEPVPDVVELGVARTLSNHGRVQVCVDNADLDVMGRFGALLRY
jgi:peptide subunit release factor 1 (eRF1)